MTADRARVWICDLTYTQQTISSDIMPAAVGCIATYAEKMLGERIDVRIFKFPERLIEALENEEAPHAIGFSNYAWNEDLSTEFARVIKRHRPGILTIFGGPNYPTTPGEQEAFLRRYPQIDFYVVKEGEIGFAKLIEALLDAGFDAGKVSEDVPSVHRLTAGGRFVAAPTVARITDLVEIPSPYLTGKMDAFFDGVMLPIIQTNRGCPFQCTFCVEGMDYYSKVAKTRNLEKIEQELDYIAERMARLRDEKRGRADLHIADSNFGMYKEDLEICRSIAEKQKRLNYPEYINVATGKNHKERVLEAAAMINGALRLSGAVQSLDETVLKNIKRSNINVEQIMDLALAASRIGANSYSEVILGLPGDTVERHLKTIRTIVEADFNIVCLYQLMLLPGTDLASEASVSQWKMVTRYRAIPRCYGYFDLFGEQINACEIERICVSNDSLTFDQYLQCRRMHLVVNLFYNDGVFKEVLRFIRMLGLSIYDWLERIYAHRGDARLDALFDAFLDETGSELWVDQRQFRAFTRERDNVKRFIAGELGANLIFKYRSLALLDHAESLAAVGRSALADILATAGADADTRRLGDELITYGQARMTGIFQHDDRTVEHSFTFDVVAFSDRPKAQDVDAYRLPTPLTYRFVHTPEQLQTVQNYTSIYGTSLAGLSRILAKVYVRKLFRTPVDVTGSASLEVSQKDLRFGQAALTGLSQFG
ncbi:MAG: B12-binding domain-containing radical SAM protein [Alphaproteobacteria bacterium]|nr:B12-binding domain-containing radical SAM protein [Alphaproteobacteria bacterium]